MAKKGGFPGGMNGMGNMQNLMKQAQKMQREMEEQAKTLAETEFEGSAGGNAVTAKCNGSKQLLEIKLSNEVVDPDDIEMLEDLIVAAVNEAFGKAENAASQNMSKLTGGLGGLGSGLGGLF